MTIAAGRAAGFLGAAIFFVTLWVPGLALADDPVVQVRTQVVLASNQGSTIDPPDLDGMKKQFRLHLLSAPFRSEDRDSQVEAGRDRVAESEIGDDPVRRHQARNRVRRSDHFPAPKQRGDFQYRAHAWTGGLFVSARWRLQRRAADSGHFA